MMRLALLFLLVCLVWQGLPGARGEGPATVFEIAHTGWHAQVDAHHHHGDGSTHYDESDESLPHNHLDQGTGTALRQRPVRASLRSGRLPLTSRLTLTQRTGRRTCPCALPARSPSV